MGKHTRFYALRGAVKDFPRGVTFVFATLASPFLFALLWECPPFGDSISPFTGRLIVLCTSDFFFLSLYKYTRTDASGHVESESEISGE